MKSAIFASIASIVGVWLLFFGLFVLDARFRTHVSDASCDNVVVLTGGKSRISYALQSVDINKPKNMFISGVYEKVKLEDILGSKQDNNGICFILGKHAKNTFENAIEINEWAVRSGVKKILLITSDYHMRRSILEIQHRNNDLKIVPYSYKSKFNFSFLANCAKEFHKTIYVYVKNFFRFRKNEPKEI